MSLRTFFRNHPFRAALVAGALLLVLFLAAAIAAGAYPVASVNGHLITASRFRTNYEAATVYAANITKSLGDSRGAEGKIPQNLQAAVLDQLIAAILVEDGARAELGADLDEIVRRKIAELPMDAELQQSAALLYGLSFRDFEREVLVPQAERDILSGRLYLKGQKIADWLTEARAKASVRIFSSELRWADGKVVAGE